MFVLCSSVQNHRQIPVLVLTVLFLAGNIYLIYYTFWDQRLHFLSVIQSQIHISSHEMTTMLSLSVRARVFVCACMCHSLIFMGPQFNVDMLNLIWSIWVTGESLPALMYVGVCAYLEHSPACGCSLHCVVLVYSVCALCVEAGGGGLVKHPRWE